VIAFADRVITLQDGRVIAEEAADAFARNLDGATNNLLIRVAEDDVTRAHALLAAAGLNVTARAGWLTVRDASPDRPLHVLFIEGIAVLESAIGSQR